MALSIELWTGGQLTGGVEQWWDDVEAALPEDADARFPLLKRVDPYGDVVIKGPELDALGRELRLLSATAPAGVQPFLLRLIGLCSAGSSRRDAELRFVGD